MKRIILTLVMLFFGVTAVQAQGFKINASAVEVLPVNQSISTGDAEISPFLAWQCGQFSGFDFFEIGRGRSFFTNHAVDFQLGGRLSFLGASSELGSSKLDPFHQLGPKLIINNLPLLGQYTQKVLSFASITHYRQTFGDRQPEETKVVWATKPLKLWGAKIWTEGFYRIRDGGRSDFGQPQIWLEFSGLKWCCFGTELETSGGEILPLFGAKLKIK